MRAALPAQVFVGLCVLMELVVFFDTVIQTEHLISGHNEADADPFDAFGVEESEPLYNLTNSLITNVTLIRLCAIGAFYLVYLRASFEKIVEKINIWLAKLWNRRTTSMRRLSANVLV